MGNCITSRKAAIPAETQTNEQPKEAKAASKAAACHSSTKRAAAKEVENRKEKRVRFRVSEKDASKGGQSCKETNNGVVRIRLVLTQKELNQILNGDSNHSSAEQLFKAIKSGSSKREAQDRSSSSDGNGDWMPVLESIPEDGHC